MTAVASTKPSRRERKKEEIRRKIVDAAVALFGKKGIDGTTADEIAAAADVGKGTIYNYFAAKEDIVVAFMADLEARTQAEAARLCATRGPLEAILAEFIRRQLELKRPHHAFVRVFLAQMFGRTESFFPYMAAMQKDIDPPLEKLFGALRRRRLIRGDVPLADLILVFKTIQLGVTALWAVEGPPFSGTEQTLQLEMRLFCQGLKSKNP